MARPAPAPILGAVLAGGRATRFGGGKALARFRGEPLVGHCARQLRPWAAEIVLCGLALAPYRDISDRPAPHLGPLGGLNAALHLAAEEGFAAVLTTACDLPIVPEDLFARLIGATPAVAEGQPMLGFWPAALAPLLDRRLAEEEDRSMRGWARAAGARIVAAPPLANVNTPADLQRLEEG